MLAHIIFLLYCPCDFLLRKTHMGGYHKFLRIYDIIVLLVKDISYKRKTINDDILYGIYRTGGLKCKRLTYIYIRLLLTAS